MILCHVYMDPKTTGVDGPSKETFPSRNNYLQSKWYNIMSINKPKENGGDGKNNQLPETRDSGNNFLGCPKALFPHHLLGYPTRNEACLKSFQADMTINEPCFESFLGTNRKDWKRNFFFCFFCRFNCNLRRLRLERRLLLNFYGYPHTHHPWKDLIIL